MRTATAARLHVILLRNLQVVTGTWPGADGMTEDDILLAYREAATASRVPGHVELSGEYPDLAGDLDTFFLPHPDAPRAAAVAPVGGHVDDVG